MKKYKVLEAHQGDKFYLPDDPVTGTRIADPNAVGHLVTLGLLEEIGDADEPDDAADGHDTVMLARLRDPVDGPKLLADLKDRFEAFDRERQELFGRIANGEEALRHAVAERDSARNDHTAALTERDALAAELVNVRQELAAGQATGDRDQQGADDTSTDSAFDHDGNGKPGGSKPRAKNKVN